MRYFSGLLAWVAAQRKESAMKPLRLVPLLLVTVTALTGPAAAGPRGQNFGTHLSGDEEVPPRDTRAQGQAKFHLNADAESLDYRLIASNIENVVAAHIHQGAVGINGPIVAFLFGDVPPGGGRTDGVLATGTITEDDLVGPLAGEDLDELIAAMRAGNTYVNVHTNDGEDPQNTGPGDFPGGEIRGQLEAHGPKR
jgi:hypothetical protein